MLNFIVIFKNVFLINYMLSQYAISYLDFLCEINLPVKKTSAS